MNRCNDILEYLILGLSVADSVFMLIIQIIFGTVWSQACRTGALLNFCHLLWVKPVDYFIKFLFSVPWDGILLFHSRKFKNKICYFRISYEKRVLTNLKFNKSAVSRHCTVITAESQRLYQLVWRLDDKICATWYKTSASAMNMNIQFHIFIFPWLIIIALHRGY